MLAEYEARKKRYQDDVIRRIEANPQVYLDLDSPSERRGYPAKAKPEPQPRPPVRFSRFAPPPEPSERRNLRGNGGDSRLVRRSGRGAGL